MTDLTMKQKRIDAFWNQVDKNAECWLWQGYIDRDGYGRFFAFGGQRPAHRIAYFLAHGDLPPDLCVCHTCDTPRCCNPAHLFLGTIAENNADMVAKGRNFVPPVDIYRRPAGPTRRMSDNQPPIRFGERNGQAKLTDSQVAELKELRAQGKKIRELAELFGISISHVGNICAGRWR